MTAEIDQAYLAHDLDALARAAHSFKGAAGNIVARRSYEAALALEQAAKRADLPRVGDALTELTGEVTGLRRALSEALGNQGVQAA